MSVVESRTDESWKSSLKISCRSSYFSACALCAQCWSHRNAKAIKASYWTLSEAIWVHVSSRTSGDMTRQQNCWLAKTLVDGKHVLSVRIKRTYGKHTQRQRNANEGANLFRKAQVWENIVNSTWGDFLSQRHSASSEEGLFFLPEAVGLHLAFSRFHCRTILFLAFKGKREGESAGSGLNRHFSEWLPIQERTWAVWETARSCFIYSGRDLLPLRQILHFSILVCDRPVATVYLITNHTLCFSHWLQVY